MACVECRTARPPYVHFRTDASRAAQAAHLECLRASIDEDHPRDNAPRVLLGEAACSDAPYEDVLACMRFLLGRGARLEPDGRRPIEWAVHGAHRPACVRALLELGAKPDTFHRPTPLEQVCDPGWVDRGMPPDTLECALRLVRAGARVWTGWDGPLGVAVRCGEAELVREMLLRGASPRISAKHLAGAYLPEERRRALEAIIEAPPARPRKRRRAK